MERPLALHESALSEAEYTAYTCILHEIVGSSPNSDWSERTEVPWGEAKGWIRGKYGVDAPTFDQVRLCYLCTYHAGADLPFGCTHLDRPPVPLRHRHQRGDHQSAPATRRAEAHLTCPGWEPYRSVAGLYPR